MLYEVPIFITEEGARVGAVGTADGTGVGAVGAAVGPLGAADGTGVSLTTLTVSENPLYVTLPSE
jgi:hypothetical protein